MKIIRQFFVASRYTEKSHFVWNFISSNAAAFQFVVILVVITRMNNGLYNAGMFSIATAIANLVYFVGLFGIRKYQISDINEEHSFGEYLFVRIITCAIMIGSVLLYCVYGKTILEYPTEKTMLVFWVCMIKAADAFSDVYAGKFQQAKRLDTAAKMSFFRDLVSSLFFIGVLISTSDIVLSAIIGFVAECVALALIIISLRKVFSITKPIINDKSVKQIMLNTFPLFLAGFLLFYIGNIAKYVIDESLSDEYQAIYNFLFMPVFVTGLLSNYIFFPSIVKLAENWNARQFKPFMKTIGFQIFFVIGITVALIIVAYTIGIPALSWLYNTDMYGYESSLAIMFLGGGLLAIINICIGILTIIRLQKILIPFTTIAIVATLLFTRPFIEKYFIFGASLSYLLAILLLALMCVIYLSRLISGKRQSF